MSDPAERVSELREQVEEQERELGAAVRDLKLAARRVVSPLEWLTESPVPRLAAAIALGWWLGSRSRKWRKSR